MMISRRTREIGIFMVMGATKVSVLRILLLGCFLRFGFAKLINYYLADLTSSKGKASQMIMIVEPEHFFYAIIIAIALNISSESNWLAMLRGLI